MVDAFGAWLVVDHVTQALAGPAQSEVKLHPEGTGGTHVSVG